MHVAGTNPIQTQVSPRGCGRIEVEFFTMTIARLRPASLPLTAAFCPGTAVQGPGRLIFVGGQNGIDARGVVIGTDLASQTKQALRNVLAVLAEAGASQKDVAKLTICLVSGHDPRDAYAA